MAKNTSPRRSSRSRDLDPQLAEHIEELIAELPRLDYDDDEERFNDIVAELVNHGHALGDRLVQLSRSLNYQERRAAIEALGKLHLPSAQRLLLGALDDANWKVQRSAALAIAQNPTAEATSALLKLAENDNRSLQLSALEALRALRATDAAPLFLQSLISTDWRVRVAAAEGLGDFADPIAIPALIGRITDDDEDVRRAVDVALAKLLPRVEAPWLREALDTIGEAERQQILEAVQKDGRHKMLGILLSELQASISAVVDEAELARFGRVMTAADHLPTLDHAFERDKAIADLRDMLRRPGNASVILVGDSGVGKTAVIHQLARWMCTDEFDGYTVLETSTPELMVGTKYIGEWETKLHGLIEKIKRPRKVLLYLTNVNDLPGAGTTSSSKQNFVTLLAPYMRRGDVTVIGESTAEGLQRGLDKDLSAKQLFQTFKLDEPPRPTVLSILHRTLELAAHQHGHRFIASPEILDLLLELSGTYYATMAQPGRSVTVLKQVINHVTQTRPLGADAAPDAAWTLNAEDVIKGLAKFTGLPELLLNDQLPLDVDQVRAFFDARVLGQREATNAIVDLITLIKAGLSDPGKPLGVFLFVGPTGVGKTEIAKTLAEFIFGSPARMIRFDLSEFKEYESFEKLIGGTIYNREEGQLTSKVREQPFSVILLDEVEKAHPNIFDLFLQVFDDGRLTDSRGRIADFRHTIIIMTSNIASAINPGGLVGFGDNPDAALASSEGVMREVRRFFRPEFLNRIDRTVVFKPLGDDTMRRIALRELGKVLLRSGILRRRLIVDLDDSVTDFLMAQGFSRAYGARPLKRAVEQHVLLPVAREIVRRGPGYEGDILSVHVTPQPAPHIAVARRNSALAQRQHDIRAAGLDALRASPLGALTAAPRSRALALKHLTDALAALDTLTARLSPDALKADIDDAESQVARPTFWDDPAAAREHLRHLARLKELHAALTLAVREAHNLRDRFHNDEPLKAWTPAFHAWLLDLYILSDMLA